MRKVTRTWVTDEESWKIRKSNQKIAMDEELVENSAMDEKLMENSVMLVVFEAVRAAL